MKLHNLTIKNFRSFRDEQVFRFPDAPGLYFMQGINAAEPRLEANGTGKSTVWEALFWLFFDKTTKGLRAGDVCNWEAGKGASVELAYEDGEQAVSMKVMRRTWKPNSWTITDLFGNTIDLDKDPSNPALAALRLEFLPFLHSIMMAQGEEMFLDLKPDTQASLFSKVLSLDYWIDLSATAATMASEEDRVARGLEVELSGLEGQVRGVRDYSKEAAEWEAENRLRIDQERRAYDDKDKELKRAINALERARDAEDAARAQYKRARARADAEADDIKGLEKELADLNAEAARFEAKRDTEGDLIDFLRDHTTCPTCSQAIDPGWRRSRCTELQRGIGRISEDLEQVDARIADIRARIRDRGAASGEALKAADEALSAAERETRNLENDVSALKRDLRGIDDQIARLEETSNPYDRLQREARRETERLATRVDELRAKLDAVNEDQALYSLWVRGFKELRLQQIAEALTELEIEVNSCLSALGLQGWELRFAVDRENKSGNIKRGFSVEVVSPSNPRAVPWASWSGGERQRLRLAGNMGLANLIRTRAGVGMPLEVWDEPSAGLSKQGVADLLECLERRARVEGRQIWIVDHTAHSFGGFAGGATITKTKAGSRIEQY